MNSISWRERFFQVRQHSLALCDPLALEDYVVQPHPDVSPPKWHLAHTTWFWEEFVLVPHLRDYPRFHPRFSFLFNSYYDTVGDRVPRLSRGNMSRPTVQEIRAYRAHVDEYMTYLLADPSADLQPLLELGLQHEQQHQELLLTDIKFILGHNPLFPPYQPEFRENSPVEPAPAGWLEVPGGRYAIGFSGSGFSFDNESARHEVLLSRFRIARQLVSNEEYLAFIQAGGYESPEHWHSDGWSWVTENQVRAPLYWFWMEGAWHHYSLTGLAPLPLQAPVTHVSYYEAAAFASWRGLRLPTEFEWEAASDQFAWGQRWEHTQSAYLPYPGFSKPAGAIGEYNGKFMINQMVLRGASVATPPFHSRKTYRNFFYPHQRWQFTGIRLCER